VVLKGAAVFVAGSAKKMPADVRQALRTVLQQYGNMVEAEAEHFLTKLAAAKKYIAEGWS
jgi:sulfite reductase alpha subunit-like flavoprotein